MKDLLLSMRSPRRSERRQGKGELRLQEGMSSERYVACWHCTPLATYIPQQIINFYVNHRSIGRQEVPPPVQVGKQWKARWVVDYLFHKELEERMKQYESLPSTEKIGKWARELSDLIDGLSEEEMAKYTLMAEAWRKQGPPEELQRK